MEEWPAEPPYFMQGGSIVGKAARIPLRRLAHTLAAGHEQRAHLSWMKTSLAHRCLQPRLGNLHAAACVAQGVLRLTPCLASDLLQMLTLHAKWFTGGMKED